MEDKYLYAIWNSELKMWLRTGKQNRKYAHTQKEVDEWIEDYKKDGDKNPNSLVLFSVDNLIKNFIPLPERIEADQ